MTRKETLKHFKTWCQNNIGNHCSDEDFQMANNIMALLEQQPCEDCISREQAINQCGFGMTSLLIADNLRKLPPVQPKPKTGHWISVSERMPDEFAVVLCNTDSEEIFIATYLGKMNDGTDCFDDANGMMCEGDVIAWMPLPEPYEPQEVRKQMKEDRLNKVISDVAYILDSLRLLREIYQTGDCNICKNKDCGYMPKPGQMVRYNCPFYKSESEK